MLISNPVASDVGESSVFHYDPSHSRIQTVLSSSGDDTSNVIEMPDLQGTIKPGPVDSTILVPYDILSSDQINNPSNTISTSSPLRPLPSQVDLLPNHSLHNHHHQHHHNHHHQSYLLPASPAAMSGEDGSCYPSEADLAAAAISGDIDSTFVTSHSASGGFENDLVEVRDIGGVGDCGGMVDDQGFQPNSFDPTYFSISTSFDLISPEF